jgi:hypothetical protein
VRRPAALAVAPLLLAAGLMAFGGGHASAAAQATQPTPSQTCILIVICVPSSASPTPAPSASSSSTAPSATPSPSGSAAPSAPGTATSTGTPAASASAGATPSAGSSSSTGSPSPTGSPSASPSPSPTQPKDATAADGLVVSNVTWTMTVGSASMNGFTYKGNVNLPLAGGGTIQMMEFTVSSMTMSNAVTTISENGQTGTETDASFSASGVTLYATQLSGSLFGTIPVTFTPSTLTVANLLKLPNAGELQLTNLLTSAITLTMTNVTADQAVILAGQAQKTTVGVTG